MVEAQITSNNYIYNTIVLYSVSSNNDSTSASTSSD